MSMMDQGMVSGMQPTASTDLPQRYRDLLEMIRGVFDQEPDEEDRAALTELMLKVQKLIARNQQDQQKLMGGDPTLSRALLKHG